MFSTPAGLVINVAVATPGIQNGMGSARGYATALGKVRSSPP